MTNGLDQAFPKTATAGMGDSVEYGLTKREYFAVMAMQGLTMAAAKYVNDLTGEWNFSFSSREAVKMADALITELNKEQKDETA